MNPHEIKKALECCNDGWCYACPYHGREDVADCTQQCGIDVLDLINRQQTEIEELQKLLGYAENCIDEFEYAYYRVGDSNSRIDDALEEYNNLVKEMTENDFKE